MHNLLGRICFQLGEYREATDHYMEALSIATIDNHQMMKMVNFSALADLRLAENRLDEAKRYRQRAQEVSGGLNDPHLFGLMYQICGKVAQAEGEQKEGEPRQRHFEEAKAFFEKAIAHLSQTEARTSLAEVYGRLAQILEMSGQQQEAISYWKAAYESLSGLKGPSLD